MVYKMANAAGDNGFSLTVSFNDLGDTPSTVPEPQVTWLLAIMLLGVLSLRSAVTHTKTHDGYRK